jgi:uncharacterized membrane protein
MAFCKNCGTEIPEGNKACTNCGTVVEEKAVQAIDHTAEFTADDISKNKVTAMAAYLLSVVGIIIALLAAPNSPYASFHCRQALKLDILSVLVSIVTVLLSWTIIVPLAGGIAAIILLVVRIICFFHVCKGKAKDAPIISSLPFIN